MVEVTFLLHLGKVSTDPQLRTCNPIILSDRIGPPLPLYFLCSHCANSVWVALMERLLFSSSCIINPFGY